MNTQSNFNNDISSATAEETINYEMVFPVTLKFLTLDKVKCFDVQTIQTVENILTFAFKPDGFYDNSITSCILSSIVNSGKTHKDADDWCKFMTEFALNCKKNQVTYDTWRYFIEDQNCDIDVEIQKYFPKNSYQYTTLSFLFKNRKVSYIEFCECFSTILNNYLSQNIMVITFVYKILLDFYHTIVNNPKIIIFLKDSNLELIIHGIISTLFYPYKPLESELTKKDVATITVLSYLINHKYDPNAFITPVQVEIQTYNNCVGIFLKLSEILIELAKYFPVEDTVCDKLNINPNIGLKELILTVNLGKKDKENIIDIIYNNRANMDIIEKTLLEDKNSLPNKNYWEMTRQERLNNKSQLEKEVKRLMGRTFEELCSNPNEEKEFQPPTLPNTTSIINFICENTGEEEQYDSLLYDKSCGLHKLQDASSDHDIKEEEEQYFTFDNISSKLSSLKEPHLLYDTYGLHTIYPISKLKDSGDDPKNYNIISKSKLEEIEQKIYESKLPVQSHFIDSIKTSPNSETKTYCEYDDKYQTFEECYIIPVINRVKSNLEYCNYYQIEEIIKCYNLRIKKDTSQTLNYTMDEIKKIVTIDLVSYLLQGTYSSLGQRMTESEKIKCKEIMIWFKNYFSKDLFLEECYKHLSKILEMKKGNMWILKLLFKVGVTITKECYEQEEMNPDRSEAFKKLLKQHLSPEQINDTKQTQSVIEEKQNKTGGSAPVILKMKWKTGTFECNLSHGHSVLKEKDGVYYIDVSI